MAPVITSPSALSAVNDKPPRKLPVIVPAIPRSLERKPKQAKPSKENASSRQTDGVESQPTASTAATAQSRPTNGHIEEGKQEKQDSLATDDSFSESDPENEVDSEFIPEKVSDHTGTHKASVIVDNEDHSVNSRRPQSRSDRRDSRVSSAFSPKRLPSAAITTDFPLATAAPLEPKEQSDKSQSAHENEGNDSATTGSIWPSEITSPDHHSQPMSTSALTVLTDNSPDYQDLSCAIDSSPTPAFESTSSQSNPLGADLHPDGYGHRQIMYREPFQPPPLSLNGTSSPSLSASQGQILDYGQISPINLRNGQHSHSRTNSSQSQSFHDDAVAPTYRGQTYGTQSYRYPAPPPHLPLGSQPPLTPSATPLGRLPQDWNSTNGYPPPWSLPYPSHQTLSQLLNAQPYYPSAFPSTFKSENLKQQTERPNMGQHQQMPSYPRNIRFETPTHLDVVQRIILEQIHAAFNKEEFADSRLVLRHELDRFPPTTWLVHGLVLAQSPKLRNLFIEATRNDEGKKDLIMKIRGHYVTPRSMDTALSICYGKLPTLADLISNTPKQTMQELLHIAATGCVLQLSSVVDWSLHNASRTLEWSNIEDALAFALLSTSRSGTIAESPLLDTATYLKRYFATSDDLANAVNGSGTGDPVTISLVESEGPIASTAGALHDNPAQAPDWRVVELLDSCLLFIIKNLPESWELDVSARPLADADRLPVTLESRSPLAKSRFRHIQFGQLPSEATAKANDIDVLLSSIFCSLPFDVLRILLQYIGRRVDSQLPAIFNERERRRRIVMQSKSVDQQTRTEGLNSSWHEAGYEEFLQTDDAGVRVLFRKWVGIRGVREDEALPKT